MEWAAELNAGNPPAVEATRLALKRLHQAQESYNACTLIDDEGALTRAADLDRLTAEGRPRGVLSGVPMVVKDLIDQAGLPTTCGSGFYREIPERSAAVVERLQAAGAVILGRTGLHEFAYGFSSENSWFGPIRNPWDPDTSPGGSSGGSAVAVAAGLTPIAIGTDTGGSIRVPAGMTGIFGLKVTHGRVPTRGVFPLAPSLDTVGPLATNIANLDLTYRAMAGVATSLGGVAVEGLRIGLPKRWIEDGPTQPAVAAGFDHALHTLTGMGAVPVEIDDPTLIPWGMISELAGAEATHVHRRFLAEGRPYGDEVAQRLEAAARVTPDQYLEAHTWRSQLVEGFARAFLEVDLMATPTVAALSKTIGDDRIDGHHHRPVLSWFSALVNHAGCPAISLPMPGTASPPVSLQLIAPWWQEELLLSVGRAVEEHGLVGFVPPPGYLG